VGGRRDNSKHTTQLSMMLKPLYALVVSAAVVFGQSTSLPDFNITNLQAGALELSNRAEYDTLPA
jgi:hypothetical protein